MCVTSQNSSSQEIRIAVADDHPVIRHAAAAALSRIAGMHIAASVASGAELLAALESGGWHLIVADLLMHSVQADSDGLHLIRRLKRLYPDTPLIVFTMVRNRDVLRELNQMNVAGIVMKSESVDTFIEAALSVARHGQRYRSAAVQAILDGPLPSMQECAERASLTGRELEVIRLCGAGQSLTEIAARLNRSISTVATQKGNAMRKLGIATNADMIRYVLDNRLAQ